MKNRLFLIIATAACLGSITSCSQDNDIVVPDGDLKAAISFNVNIGQTPDPQANMRGTTKTTGGTGYVFANGDKVCVAITGKGSTSRSTSEETKLYKVETAEADAGNTTGTPQSIVYEGTATDAFQWLSQSETISLRAWSDGTNTTTTTVPEGNTFTISTTQNADSYTKELLYSPATDYTYAANSTSLNIPLYHQLARVVVNVANPSSTTDKYYDDAFTVNSVTIGTSTNKVPTQATFAVPASGNLGSWNSQGTDGIIATKAETTVGTNKATYSAVIIPYDGTQTGATYYKGGDEFIVIATSRGTYTYKLPAAGINFEPGKQYTFTITNLNEILLNVKVTAWTTETPSRSLTLE